MLVLNCACAKKEFSFTKNKISNKPRFNNYYFEGLRFFSNILCNKQITIEEKMLQIKYVLRLQRKYL